MTDDRGLGRTEGAGMGECSVDGCGKPLIARKLCSTHYGAARRAGQFKVRTHPRKPLLERLMERIDQSGGPDACWPWTGTRQAENGYGLTYIFDGDKRVTAGAHRAIYEATVGPIEDGMYILHGCHNPPCCNPAHLRQGTHRENMADRQEHGAANPNGNWLPHAPYVAPETVAAVRVAYQRPGHSHRSLAAQFGLSKDQVANIVNYRGRWAESA